MGSPCPSPEAAACGLYVDTTWTSQWRLNVCSESEGTGGTEGTTDVRARRQGRGSRPCPAL